MIFISRRLAPDSPLLRWATDRGQEIVGRSLLTFAPVAFTAPQRADWWFFYSKRAVQFAGDIPPDVRVAAIGTSTAAALLKACGRVDFCGNGHPDRVAEDFLVVGEGLRVFFPRAGQSRLSIQRSLQDRIEVLDAVCYDNRPNPPAAAIDADTYIFTSPLNVAAYLDHWPLRPGARVFAIGPSTGAELLRRGVDCRWPEEASEAGLVGLLG
ncbi:uroporphyrinogen-III synthase [Lewinella aquimaris]|uniref:Uroporphyrinogen-III synthase n=1 Tax=Neolewinella aquimaris TaxID=1835722 RepID=A0A840E322_9BACT|nr:uroporphyrinogen-III synthase [Neolewinella aquimaris]MBB4078363.1 uroporphyrinogen-III synthase [Neolewinella aquimaris]